MSKDRIAVIDVETTGLSPWGHDRVIEIAIVIISTDGQIHTEYETLVNPSRDLGPTRIHQILASDVLQAPSFSDVAGDVLELLTSCNVIAGHNVSFDKNFLVREYERIGVTIPDTKLLCTCRLFGRNKLEACCEDLGISFKGTPHRALSDARATAQIVEYLCADDPTLLDNYRLENVQWSSIPALRTPCFNREHARSTNDGPPKFLQRIAGKIHHNVDADTPNLLAYLALIDRVLEVRAIDKDEENVLVDAALNWHLSAAQLDSTHRQYIHTLAVHALADGVITDSERRDLHTVAKLLGQNDSLLDALLESAAAQLASAYYRPQMYRSKSLLRGQRVCFTGELRCTIRGQPMSRDIAETLASQAGLVIVSCVTKKLDILVVADPHTQSSKAKKARDYGIRILSDAVFWKMADITVD